MSVIKYLLIFGSNTFEKLCGVIRKLKNIKFKEKYNKVKNRKRIINLKKCFWPFSKKWKYIISKINIALNGFIITPSENTKM